MYAAVVARMRDRTISTPSGSTTSGSMGTCLQWLTRRALPAFALAAFLLLLAGAIAGNARAQITNGDFSGGSTGWTSTIPGGSSLSYASGQLRAVSDNDGGSNSRTYASQTFTAGDPGFLSMLMRSWTTADYGQYDYPLVRIGTTNYWVTTAGGLSTSGAGASINNDDAPISNLTVRRTFAAGTWTIGLGVTATDSCCGSGTAIWDNVEFQELTQSPGAQTTPFNTSLALSGANALQVATNSGAASMTVTLTVTNGTLTLASLAGITITGGANGSNTVTFSGSPANLNNALNGLVYAPTTGFSGAETLTFFANGGGVSDTDTISITVTPPVFSFTVSKTTPTGNVIYAGEIISYTITVNNTGTGTFVSPAVSDLLDQNGSTTALTLSGPAGDGGVAGTMEPGETWIYTASHTVTQANVDDGNNLVNTFTFNPAETAQQSDSATTTIGTIPQLAVVKSYVLVKAPGNTHPDAEVGDTINYSYEVSNTGNITFTDVEISDSHNGYGTLPDPAGETLTTDGGVLVGDSTDVAADNGIWSVLRPGDTVTFTTSYTVTQQDKDFLN